MNQSRFDCKTFQQELPDLVLTPGAVPSAAAQLHLAACEPCSTEYLAFQDTFAALDAWTVPQPTAYFDQKLAVRLREEIAAPPMGWLERLTTSFTLNTSHTFRPLLAGALVVALAVSGGGLVTADYMQLHPTHTAPVAATVNDLQILDRNEQAFQQLDLMQQDADSSGQPADLPAS